MELVKERIVVSIWMKLKSFLFDEISYTDSI